MRIGLDFDNTIVCYDQAIAQLAEELFELPEEVPRTKLGLREHLRAAGRELEWTAFQGELYGPGMRYAQPFAGAIDTMKHLFAEGHELAIVSHRSLRPYAGPQHDLHRAARNWIAEQLQSNALFGSNGMIDFMETREKKISRISELSCRAFVDDLPEVLDAQGFPVQTRGILFDPSGSIKAPVGCSLIATWTELEDVVASIA